MSGLHVHTQLTRMLLEEGARIVPEIDRGGQSPLLEVQDGEEGNTYTRASFQPDQPDTGHFGRGVDPHPS